MMSANYRKHAETSDCEKIKTIEKSKVCSKNSLRRLYDFLVCERNHNRDTQPGGCIFGNDRASM